MTSWQDAANGAFELLSGVMVLLHCRQLHKDKEVRGASWVATAFFFAWGVWNLYYYPHLNQWLSFIGGLGIVVANCLWLGMMLHYIRHEDVRELLAQQLDAASADQRRRFEAWADDQGFPLRRLETSGGYLDLRTQGAWEAWQASYLA